MALLIYLTLITLTAAARCNSNPTIFHFKVGTTPGIVLSDGPLVFADNPFINVPRAAVDRSFADLFISTSPIFIDQNVMLLDTPNNGRLLFDAGSPGAQFIPVSAKGGRIFENLAAAGIDPKTVDGVLITHAHYDHVLGILNAEGGRTFPNAKVYIDRTDHEFWIDPFKQPNITIPAFDDELLQTFSDLYVQAITPYGDDLILVGENRSPLPGIRFILGPGHSPGHSAIEVTLDDKILVVAGDNFLLQGGQVRNPEWAYSTESNQTLAYNSRIELMELVAGRRDLVLSFHEAFPGLGYVVRKGPTFDWVPANVGLSDFGVALQC